MKWNAYRNLVGKRRGWCKDNIEVDLREIGCGSMGWIDLDQNEYRWMALVNTMIYFRVEKFFWKFLSSCAFSGYSRRTLLHGVNLMN
jgi:hypothetical protein